MGKQPIGMSVIPSMHAKYVKFAFKLVNRHSFFLFTHCSCRDPEPFDWYQRYSGVRDLINQYIKREDIILMNGCGNSRLTEDMFEDGK